MASRPDPALARRGEPGDRRRHLSPVALDRGLSRTHRRARRRAALLSADPARRGARRRARGRGRDQGRAAGAGRCTASRSGSRTSTRPSGIRTTAGSRVYETHVPSEDAETWVRLRNAGAILLGKQETHEFAIGGPDFTLPFPPARNPWNTAHYPAGSSSGSAAAVGAHLCAAAMGSDTGGSIRGPAAYCGIVGLKPTYGRVSRRGVFPLSYTLDHCGPLTRTVEDCALMMQVLAGHDPLDPASRRCAGARIRRGADAAARRDAHRGDPPLAREGRGRRVRRRQHAVADLYRRVRRAPAAHSKASAPGSSISACRR